MNKKNIFAIIFIFIFMSVIVWANLAKSQDDPETIEQMVARKIAEHNNASVAHNDPGQSLDLHRKDTIIDHPRGSIKNDKGSFSIFDYQNYFSDFASWEKSGGYSLEDGWSVFFQATNGNGTFRLLKSFDENFVNMANDYSKKFMIEAILGSSSWNNNQKVRLGLGDYSFATNVFFGFEVVGNKINAVARKTNGTQYRYEIPSFDPLDETKHAFKSFQSLEKNTDFLFSS